MNGLPGLLRRMLPGEKAELGALAAIFAAAAGVLCFALIAGEVLEGDTEAFDRAILLAFRHPADLAQPIGPSWMAGAIRDLTSLGSTVMLTLIVVATAGYLLLDDKRESAVLVLASAIGGTLLGQAMKAMFGRERPEVVPHLMVEHSLSFPSGHAMMSAVIYLTLGALLARVQEGGRQKAYIFGVAVLVALIVGLSRIYLGVHYPTDVLAGWSVGAAWAMGCLLAADWLEYRRRR